METGLAMKPTDQLRAWIAAERDTRGLVDIDFFNGPSHDVEAKAQTILDVLNSTELIDITDKEL